MVTATPQQKQVILPPQSNKYRSTFFENIQPVFYYFRALPESFAACVNQTAFIIEHEKNI